MNFFRTRKWIAAPLALMAVLAMAGCKGESSPTAPSPTGGGGGVTPPSGSTVTLSVSNPTPVVDSSSTITATVAQGGTAVPNGTAVEFQTDFASFSSTADVKTIIKTTTNGVATATLFSSTSGTAAVTATVNNVTKGTTIRFVDKTVQPPVPNTDPTITGVTPSVGSPNGGQIITISGTNFRAPLKVLFDPGTGVLPTEVSIVSASETAIQVLTPKVNIAAGQQSKFNITVITQQGSTSERRVSSAAAFTFQLDVLTPTPTTASPASGPIDGGTRVTIFGSGFQSPVQVFFGAAEATVIKTTFDQIIAISPTARTAGVTTGAVGIRIINLTSAKEATLASGFNYAEKMHITAVGPTQGPITGGTRVTIDGNGFDTGGVAVTIGGVAAQPVFVSGTRLIAITGAPTINGCSNIPGPTSVVNINNGDSDTGPTFTFILDKPFILSVTTTATPFPGTNAFVTVANALGTPRITIGGQTATISGSTTNPDGSVIYTIVIPANVKLDTLACTGVAGANAPQPTSFDVVYTSLLTSCTDTATKALTVSPPNTPVLFVTPPSFTPFTATITPASAGPPPTPATVTGSTVQTVTLANIGSGPLNITGASTTCGAQWSISLPAPQTLNQCDSAPVSAKFNGSTVPSSDSCSITISTNAGPNKVFNLNGNSQ